MPKIRYKDTRLNRSSMRVVEFALDILDEYRAKNLSVTLRQLYYQFVARGLLAENTQKEYKRIGSIINDARLAGLIDWYSLQDRTRNLRGRSHFIDEADVIQAAAYSYHRDQWEGQKNKVEVWIEKDALAGVIETACYRLDTPYFSCRGYNSQSEMWAAAQRLKHYNANGQRVIILHLGDHDPSGRDMTRDIADRMEMFGAVVTVERIALTIEQVRQYNPPPNFAKITDTRAKEYIAEFGESSWELDALEPTMLSNLVSASITRHLNIEKFERIGREVEKERRTLQTTATHWAEVSKFVRRKWEAV